MQPSTHHPRSIDQTTQRKDREEKKLLLSCITLRHSTKHRPEEIHWKTAREKVSSIRRQLSLIHATLPTPTPVILPSQLNNSIRDSNQTSSIPREYLDCKSSILSGCCGLQRSNEQLRLPPTLRSLPYSSLLCLLPQLVVVSKLPSPCVLDSCPQYPLDLSSRPSLHSSILPLYLSNRALTQHGSRLPPPSPCTITIAISTPP